ncbi:hypothetical protein [Streptomyces sp. NPDC056144]|uniref:hypothetical protein n=1 Tax=unclassified Streptomyces TaxID=2593676 RepID=UPI0035D5C588
MSDACVLSGYFIAVPERLTGPGLPRTERLTSASECLIDRFPDDGRWFGTAQEALAAAGTDEPVLLAHLDGQGAGQAARQVAEGGHELGWEVLGYDCGLLHTWLCNDLYEEGRLHLGVDTDERGLLPDRQAALRVAAWANMHEDTKPVTWFPGALIEWDISVASHRGPSPS